MQYALLHPASPALTATSLALFICRGKERPRLRGDIALNSKEYSGKRSSRKDFFEDEEDDAAGLLSEAASSDNDDLEDASEEEGSEDELMDGVDEDDSGDDDQQSEGDEEGSDGGDDEGQHMGNGLHAREVRGQSSDDGDETEDDAAALEREYRAVQEEEALAVAGLQERAVKEKKKAVAVRAQCSIWNAGLEMRILMQKALQGANKLPQPESHRVAVALDESLASGLAGLSADALSTLEELLALLEALAEQNPALRQAQEAAGVAGRHQDELGEDDEGAKVDRAWALLDGAYQRFAPYRDASIDRWHRKTVLSSGGAARGSLKVLNQSISSQVQLLMRDTERVVQRAQLAKRQRTVLCAISDEVSGPFDREGGRVLHLLRRNLEI